MGPPRWIMTRLPRKIKSSQRPVPFGGGDILHIFRLLRGQAVSQSGHHALKTQFWVLVVAVHSFLPF